MKGLPKQILETIEGIAGRILGAALAVSAILVCFLQIDEIQKLNLFGQIASWLLVVLVCLMETMYVLLILTTSNADAVISPIPEVAMRQPRLPKLLRPIAAVFWLAHFLFIIALIYISHESWGTSSSWAVWSGEYFLAFLFDFLAFGYLLFAVTSFTKEAKIISNLWKHRALISSLIALLSMYAPSFLPIQHHVN